MPIKIGITGGIGSGKSIVSAILRILNIPVYDCDTRAKELMQSHKDIRQELIQLLGEESYFADGRLNKPILARYLFASQENALRINAIVHPKIRADFHQWVSTHSSCHIVALESAILYEAAFEKEVDNVWIVIAPTSIRTARVMKRDYSTLDQVQARMTQQASQDDLAKMADHTLLNDDRTAVFPQVLQLLQNIGQSVY